MSVLSLENPVLINNKQAQVQELPHINLVTNKLARVHDCLVCPQLLQKFD